MNTNRAANPEKIIDIATGFMPARQLITASRIGLFAALADGALTADQLADATGVAVRQVRILADSMSAQGLLDRVAGQYRLTTDSAGYLSGKNAEVDLAPFLAFLGEISYRQWLGYDHTVDTDQPGTLDLDESGWGAFMAGVMTYNQLHAQQFAAKIDFSRFRNGLDLGGLSPAFGIGALQANPELRLRFVYASEMADGVRQALQAAGFGDRVAVEGADTATAEPGGEHDLIFVNHVVHRFDERQNRSILEHARAAAADGATLLLTDFFLDDDPHQRALDAVHAGEYYNIDGTVVYPEREVREWLAAAGWRPDRVVPLPGSPRVLVATAV